MLEESYKKCIDALKLWFEPSNFQNLIWSTDPYGKFLSYATLGGYVACLGDEEWNEMLIYLGKT